MDKRIARSRFAAVAALGLSIASGCGAPGEELWVTEEDFIHLPPTSHVTGHQQGPALEQGAEIESFEATAAAAPPAHFDWKDRDQVTPVRDQQSCGSCWAFASVAAVEANTLIRLDTTYARDPIHFSEQYLLSCDFDKNDSGCDGGDHAYALPWIKAHGLVDDSQLPYRDRDPRHGAACPAGLQPRHHIARWGFVTGSSETTASTTARLKNALLRHGPLVVSVYANRAWDQYTHGVLNGGHARPSDMNHEVVLTGWDDHAHAFHIKNQWGRSWGEAGYAWLKYGTSGIGIDAAWVETR